MGRRDAPGLTCAQNEPTVGDGSAPFPRLAERVGSLGRIESGDTAAGLTRGG